MIIYDNSHNGNIHSWNQNGSTQHNPKDWSGDVLDVSRRTSETLGGPAIGLLTMYQQFARFKTPIALNCSTDLRSVPLWARAPKIPAGCDDVANFSMPSKRQRKLRIPLFSCHIMSLRSRFTGTCKLLKSTTKTKDKGQIWRQHQQKYQ